MQIGDGAVPGGGPAREGPLDRFARSRPDIVLMTPYLVYLLLLGVRDLLPPHFHWLASLLRGVGGLAVVWLFRRHLPPWGRPLWGAAIAVGVLSAAGWYYGQYFFNALGVPHRLPLPFLFSGQPELTDPRDVLGGGSLFRTTALLRIGVAITTVPVVEELFWRAFLLRAMIDWHDFEKIPLGTFTWFSFLGTSLISTLQHPDNWAVSILCWFAFNALMYWKRSILCLVITHAVTNLVLYAWVLIEALRYGNRQAWMFW
jgi:hypothetical protein